MNEKWVILNGDFYKEKEAVIPVTDRGFLFGEGIFTSIRVENGTCEFLHSHFQRLQQQAQALHFHWEPFRFSLIIELIKRNQADKNIWRLKIIVTITEKEGQRQTGHVLVTLTPAHDLSFSPCNLCLFPSPIESPLAQIKSLSYLDHLYVRDYAQRRGYVDAITRTANGFLLETGCSNFFWFDQGKYWIPHHQLPYLKGVFLQSILFHFTCPVEWVSVTIDQVPSSANIYLCNALTHIRPVLSIENTNFSRNESVENNLRSAIAHAIKSQGTLQ